MRRIVKHFNLKKYNTFGIEAFSDFFFAFTDIVELKSFLKNDLYNHMEKRVLGGGSNVLLTGNYKGTIIYPISQEIKLKKKRPDYYLIKADAGLNWDKFVEYSISQGWYGLENLSGIPGNVGASPIQNIGAYGVEVKDFISKVEAVNLETHEIEYFHNEQCHFGYRNSIFKNELKNQYVITAVFFKLLKKENLKLDYNGLVDEVAKIGKTNALNLREAVLKIREAKLPNPDKLPNAGSFFKNPIISQQEFKRILKRNTEIPHYINPDNLVKIPAAWLIEACGFKGYKTTKVAVHSKQALVIINRGKASAKNILQLAEKIQNKVYEDFGISLEREVNIFP